MPTKKSPGRKKDWVDPDDAPHLTREWFAKADWYVGETPVRRARGRPPSLAAKKQVTIRLEPELLERLRATGPGWQARIGEAVREWLAKRAA